MSSAWTVVVFFIITSTVCLANWDEWWTYEGISGPAYWGMFNPEWHFCDKGRRQSPINIDPHSMLFDPLMPPLNIDSGNVEGRVVNTGRLLIYTPTNNSSDQPEGKPIINISGGPLSYTYRFSQFHIHHGAVNRSGSEHKIHGHTYPAEIQLYGFNSQLYTSMDEALSKPHGTVAIAVMIKIGEKSSPQMSRIAACFPKVHYKESECELSISVSELLPSTNAFITYEGSMTQPGCWESTCWLIMNKPLYMTSEQLSQLQSLVQGSKNDTKGMLSNNVRPIQPLYHRTVRTNIQFISKKQDWCPSLRQNVFYRANTA